MNAKEKALNAAISNLEDSFGVGTVMRLGEKPKNLEIKAISTGSLALDVALGIGGVPRGRVTEIFGAEAAGKSSLAMSTVAQAQKAGGTCAYVDVEHALDPNYARILGVDIENLIISQPDSAESALEVVDQLVRTGALDIVVLDSVAALVPSSELDGNMGSFRIGEQARLMSQALRKLTGGVSKTNTACIFINQLRVKVGTFYGNPEVTSGGNALKYYASVRIDLRRREILKLQDKPIGSRIRARVVKNKVAPPFKFAEMLLYFDSGIDVSGDILEVGEQYGVITRKGSYYYMNDQSIGRGKEQANTYLINNPETADFLVKLIRETAFGNGS